MNGPKRTALILALHRLYAAGKRIPPKFEEFSNKKLRAMRRAAGLGHEPGK